jgi:CubicO group peptidase (beta-lactamase class C family)
MPQRKGGGMGKAWRYAAVSAVFGFGCVGALAEPVSRDKVLAALPRLDAMAQQLVANRAVPGLAIAVVHEGQVVFLKGFGLREMGKAEAVDPDTVFQIASLSKPVSATVVAALVSAGVVEWGGKIADLDPAFRLHDAYPSAEVTLRDLFAHRSGLPGGAGNDIEAIGFDRDTVMNRLRLVPPSSSFRAGYSYSNAGLTAGALAAAKPTGKSWEEVADTRLFKPLGMTATSARYADFVDRADRAALHVDIGHGWEAKVLRDADVQAPAGGISSSARDLAQWMRLELANGMLDGERRISADALAATHEPLMSRGANPVTGAASFYGLGWVVEYGRHGLSWGHAGAFSAGARTLVQLYPDSSLGILVLANAFPSGAPEGLADSYFDWVFDGQRRQDWLADWDGAYSGLFGPAIEAAKATYAKVPQPPTAALPLAAYAGRYRNAYVGDAVLAEAGGTLTLALGPNGETTFPLKHFDRDQFLAFVAAEMPDTSSAVRFAIGPAGKAETVTIEFLDDNQLGTLTRVTD